MAIIIDVLLFDFFFLFLFPDKFPVNQKYRQSNNDHGQRVNDFVLTSRHDALVTRLVFFPIIIVFEQRIYLHFLILGCSLFGHTASHRWLVVAFKITFLLRVRENIIFESGVKQSSDPNRDKNQTHRRDEIEVDGFN